MQGCVKDLLETHHGLRIESKIILGRLEFGITKDKKLSEVNEKLNKCILMVEESISSLQSLLPKLSEIQRILKSWNFALKDEEKWLQLVKSSLEDVQFEAFGDFSVKYDKFLVSNSVILYNIDF